MTSRTLILGTEDVCHPAGRVSVSELAGREHPSERSESEKDRDASGPHQFLPTGYAGRRSVAEHNVSVLRSPVGAGVTLTRPRHSAGERASVPRLTPGTGPDLLRDVRDAVRSDLRAAGQLKRPQPAAVGTVDGERHGGGLGHRVT